MADPLPAIKRARIERLDIYEISESELAELERGPPDFLFLNFAIFVISSALSFLVTLLTTSIPIATGFRCAVLALRHRFRSWRGLARAPAVAPAIAGGDLL